jgi:molybdenum cofactor cytidylyltransferase
VFVAGVVLAAGRSVRLGEPKQLLPYQGRTLLDATVYTARVCGFAQLIVTLGGAAEAIRAAVDLTGADLVYATGPGCDSSIRSAVEIIDPRADGLVLLLGDQPGVRPDTVARLLATSTRHPMGVCRYADGLGHPMWFARRLFGELTELHGDKAVWKLLHSGRYPVAEAQIKGAVPIDVDTREDYERLLAGDRS